MLDKWAPDDNLLDRFVPSDHSKQAHAEQYVLQFLKTGRIRRVLDLGCGNGHSYDLFQKQIPGVEWVGLDVRSSPEMRSRTRTDTALCIYDGTHMPFPVDVFDLVYCRQVLQHVRRPWDLLREVHRVLKPGGLIAGSTSQLEPYQTYSMWNLTLYGFSCLVEEAGLRLLEVRPGIDSLTFIVRRGVGRRRFSRWLVRESPLNVLIGLVGWVFRKDHKWMNRIKLLFCSGGL